MSSRVAMISAGPCSLAQLRAFDSASKAGAPVPEVVCFEKQTDRGHRPIPRRLARILHEGFGFQGKSG